MWYLILSRRQPDIPHAKMVIHEHFKWMQARHAAGDVLFSGPKPDRTMGIYVIQAASVAAATAIADSDPLHVSGQRTYELIEWEVHQVLGVGPFSVAGVHALAQTGAAPHYTKIPS